MALVLLGAGGLILAGCHSGSASAEPSVRTLIDKTIARYAKMKTYVDHGTVVIDMETAHGPVHQKTDFSLKLKMRDQYLIAWSTQGAPPAPSQIGALWNEGTQPYLYLGATDGYAKVDSDELAISLAVGASGGAAMTVPALFFPQASKLVSLARLKKPVIEKIEAIAGDPCYVVTGTGRSSSKQRFWISKAHGWLVQYQRALDPPPEGLEMPPLSDAQLEQSLRDMGREPTPANMKRLRDAWQRSQDTLQNMKITGVSTETHLDISSPDLLDRDFHFAPPDGSVMQGSPDGAIPAPGR
jgi:hypothetical protein